jgi:cardiolipin synthase
LLPAVVILCREILVSGLREFLAEIRVGMPVTRLAQWKTTVQILALGFLIVGPAGPDFGPVSTTMIGDVCLWIAGVFTLFTGYDYLRAGSKHLDISVEVNQISVPPPEAGTGRGKDAA